MKETIRHFKAVKMRQYACTADASSVRQDSNRNRA
jgi:hypothetical protein